MTVGHFGEVDRVPRPRFRPVQAWAVVGGVACLIDFYVLAAWVLSGEMTPTPTGPTPVPDGMALAIHGAEIVGGVAFAAFVLAFLVRPWRREGAISSDGMFVLVFLSLAIQDPLLNYSQYWMTYNAEFVNLGSWAGSIPGWMAPDGHQWVEPILWIPPIYVYGVFGATMVAGAGMRRLQLRWPRLRPVALAMICAGAFIAFCSALFPIILLLGFASYPGAPAGVTAFAGRHYQLPLTEAVFFGGTCAAWACLRFFKDDHGHTVVERGAERLSVSPRRRQCIRLLALTGACNLIFLFGYGLPNNWIGLRAGRWPDEVVDRSYLTNGLCGPGTDYACPGPGVPIPRPTSLHLTPEGTLGSP